MQKTAFKSRTWTKKFSSLRKHFFTHPFLALSKTAVWTKTTLFSLRSSLFFSTRITQNFFTRFISRFKIHSKNWLKKGLLQYSSSSRKKHSRTSPDVQFKEFSLTKQKTRPRTDYEWIGKTISKKSDKNKKKQKINVETPIARTKHH